jgi:hypothetical protein
MQTMNAITDTTNSQHRSWRDVLPIHPAAEKLPLLSQTDPAALRELADDIEKNGLLERVSIIKEDGKLYLLDGRNRLDALELLDYELFDEDQGSLVKLELFSTKGKPHPKIFKMEFHTEDPPAFVISKNVRRRHLTAEDKRDLIANVLKAKPEASNREIAREVKADDKTIAKVRTELEATAEIPQLKKTKGKDGRARPARKTKPTPSASAPEAPTPSTSESSTSAPSEAKPDAVVADADTSAAALANFKYACTHWLPKMSAEDRAEAVRHAARFAGTP